MSINEIQIGGTHYKTEFQHWDLVAMNDWGYFESQITKYLTRWRKKNGVQDLEKALHYCDKLIDLIEQGNTHDGNELLSLPEPRPMRGLTDFAAANNLTHLEYLIFLIVGTYTSIEELGDAQRLLLELKSMAEQEAK